jgi:hypothetical protein
MMRINGLSLSSQRDGKEDKNGTIISDLGK